MRTRSPWLAPLLLAPLLLAGCPKAPPSESAPAAEAVAIPTPATDEVIPSDPSVRMGVLDNGLHWYVEDNARPEDRATLRLVVKVGSVVEDDDQQGLAHFLEHMAFNGTENFQGNALIDYMESIGMEFGAHLNAYTSFDETVYLLTVPTDDPTLVDTGLQVLRDQAGSMLLTEEEIERERGVVLEEWRLSLGAQTRIQRQLWANAFPDSHYSERFPIGTEASLKTFSPDALRRFYADWYRPELMGVIAVGDFDPDQVQSRIEALFADLENPESARPRTPVDIPAFDPPKVFVVTDAEATSAMVLLDDQYDGTEGSTWRDYRDDHILPSLLYFIINERLSDLSRDADGPVAGAQAGQSRHNAAEEETSLFVGVRGDRTLDAVSAVVLEVERIRRHGVTDSELARAKTTVAAQFEEYGKTAATMDSTTHAEELQRVFLEGESMPGIPVEVAMVETWLPGVTRAEVNARAATFLTEGSQLVQVVVPEREGFTVPTVEAVTAALTLPPDTVVAPPEDAAVDGPLVADPPPADGGVVVERSGPDALGVTTLVLGNGVRVGVLPTDYSDDEVVLSAQSPGGMSQVDDARYRSGELAGGFVAMSGLGTFDPETLGKRLSGVRAQARAGISGTSEWVRGGASADSVEAMLQQVWLHFTAPRFTETGADRLRVALREARQQQERSPGSKYADARRTLLYGEGLRIDPIPLDAIDAIDPQAAAAVWAERFADAADFHWMIVGDVELDTLEPLVARWLGQLPATPDAARETVDPTRVPPLLPGQRSEVVRDGDTPRATVQVTWHGPAENTWTSRNRMMALTDIVSGRLRTVLREDLGGVYGVSLSGSVAPHPTDHFQVQLSFSCDPERVDELLQAAQDQLDAVMDSGVTPEEIAVEQEQNRRDRQQRVRTNGFWAGAITGALARGDDPAELLTWDARNDSLGGDELQALAQRVWGAEASRVQAVWVPKSE